MSYKEVALTADQQRKWDETRVALLWQQPAFAHIFYTLLNTRGTKNVALFTKELTFPNGQPAWAATDGKNIIINPESFFQLPLMQRVFVVAHEIMHCIWNHLILMHGFKQRGKISYPDGKELPYDHETMNKATDLVINDLLASSSPAVGEKPSWVIHDPKIATGKDSAMDAYRKIFKNHPGGQGFDIHLEPGASDGKDPNEAAGERNEAEWQTEIAAAIASARAQGKLPGALESALSEILNPQVDWREKIQALFARKVGAGSYDWRRADRRLIVRDIYAPGRSGFGAECVVVGVDTSGSINDDILNVFMAEMAGILEDVRPKRMIIAWADAKVHRVDEAEEPSDLNEIRAKGAPGRGGTDFRPVFEEIAAMNITPDALVYLTDGYGSFGSEPSYPVIWASISPEGSVQYPFGDVVYIPQSQ